MNSKGFTLVELLATIVLLALIMGITTYSIASIIQNSKNKNYELLVNNVKTASELYYQECKYGDASAISCNIANNKIITKLATLVEYGYLKGNSTNDDKHYTIVNPKNNENIGECYIEIAFVNGRIQVVSTTDNENCPT